jgi:hypothetical protein
VDCQQPIHLPPTSDKNTPSATKKREASPPRERSSGRITAADSAADQTVDADTDSDCLRKCNFFLSKLFIKELNTAN